MATTWRSRPRLMVASVIVGGVGLVLGADGSVAAQSARLTVRPASQPAVSAGASVRPSCRRSCGVAGSLPTRFACSRLPGSRLGV